MRQVAQVNWMRREADALYEGVITAREALEYGTGIEEYVDSLLEMLDKGTLPNWFDNHNLRWMKQYLVDKVLDDLETYARERVAESDALDPFTEAIFYDWPNWDEHIQWVVLAPEKDIMEWLEHIQWSSA